MPSAGGWKHPPPPEQYIYTSGEIQLSVEREIMCGLQIGYERLGYM